jgi:hypothetical protein
MDIVNIIFLLNWNNSGFSLLELIFASIRVFESVREMEHHLTTPVREEDVRKLRMGDLVYVTGTVITARDEAHLKALELRPWSSARKARSPPSTSKGSEYSTAAPS